MFYSVNIIYFHAVYALHSNFKETPAASAPRTAANSGSLVFALICSDTSCCFILT